MISRPILLSLQWLHQCVVTVTTRNLFLSWARPCCSLRKHSSLVIPTAIVGHAQPQTGSLLFLALWDPHRCYGNYKSFAWQMQAKGSHRIGDLPPSPAGPGSTCLIQTLTPFSPNKRSAGRDSKLQSNTREDHRVRAGDECLLSSNFFSSMASLIIHPPSPKFFGNVTCCDDC